MLYLTASTTENRPATPRGQQKFLDPLQINLLWQQPNLYCKNSQPAHKGSGTMSFKTHSCKRLALRKKANGVFSWRWSPRIFDIPIIAGGPTTHVAKRTVPGRGRGSKPTWHSNCMRYAMSKNKPHSSGAVDAILGITSS